MIDWHSHILPGLDDGAADLPAALLMAAALSQAGFTTVCCTPHHIRGCYQADNGQVRRGVTELQGRLDDAAIPLTLLAGREYYLDEFLPEMLTDPLPLGESGLILVEIPPHMTGELVRRMIHDLVRGGFTPLIAHPERCPLLELPRRPAARNGVLGSLGRLFGDRPTDRKSGASSGCSGNALLDYLRDIGCHFQGNLGSFGGFYGRQVAAAAESLRSGGIYDRYGSDLHSPEQAGVILKSAAALYANLAHRAAV